MSVNVNGNMGGKTEEKSHGEDDKNLEDNIQPSTDGAGKHHQEQPDKAPENPRHVMQGQNDTTQNGKDAGDEGHSLEADSVSSDKSDNDHQHSGKIIVKKPYKSSPYFKKTGDEDAGTDARVRLKNRMIRQVNDDNERHKFMTLPEERKRREERVAKMHSRITNTKDEIANRLTEWQDWEQDIVVSEKERHEDSIIRQENQGDSIVKDRVDGVYLLQETGVEGDKLILDHLDIEREGRLYDTAHEVLKNSDEVKQDYQVYGKAQEVSQDAENERVIYENDISRRKVLLEQMNKVRAYAVALEEEHKRCTYEVEHGEADLAARTDRLKKAGPGMTFEERGAARRKLMEDKEAYENLVGHAKAVEIEVKKWREHIQLHGFQPYAVPDVSEIDRLTVLKDIDPDFLDEATKKKRLDEMAEIEEQANKLAKRKKKRKRILPPWEKAKIKEDLPEPPPLDEILDTLPPPEKGSFRSLVMDGQTLGRLDLADRLQARLDRKDRTEREKADEMQKQLQQASQSLRDDTIDDLGEEERLTLPPIVDEGAVGEDAPAQIIPPGKNKKFYKPRVDTDMQVLQAPNTFYQMAMDDTTVIKLGGGVTVIDGLHNDQVPPLCKEWVLLRCPNSKDVCSKRHYYTSKEEKARSAKLRTEVDARLERKVVEALTQREDLLKAIMNESSNATRRFQDHVGSYVRENDVRPLLDLLAQMRAATVEVVENIKEWRNAVRVMRLKMKHGGGPGAMERAAAAQGFAVKILVEGELLYRGCPPYESKVKRFSRARTLDKKADKWVQVGYFKTEYEAATAYEKARNEQAVLHNTTVDRMYEKIIFLRPCGHYAVESKVKHLGKQQSVCELCKVKSLEGGVEFNAPFLWNGMNYLLKIPHDMDFLNKCEPLREYLGPNFPLVRNPFSTIYDLDDVLKPLDYQKISNEATSGGAENRNGEKFGQPGAKIIKYSNGTTEWFGHLAVGTTLTIGENKTYMPQIPFSRKQLEDFVDRNEGKDVQVLDMERIQYAGYTILQELEIAQMMDSIEDDIKRKKEGKNQRKEPENSKQLLNNNEEDNIAQHKVSEPKHDHSNNASQRISEQSGNVQLQSQPKLARDGESSQSPTEKPQTMLPSKSIQKGFNRSTEVSSELNAEVPKNDLVMASPHKLVDSPPPPPSYSNGNSFFVPPEGFFENLTAEIQLDFKKVDEDGESDTDESVDEVALEEEREASQEKARKQKIQEDLQRRATVKIARYSQGGVSLKVPQKRLPKQSKKKGIWLNPDEGEFKVCFDGMNFTNNGFTVRGKRLQHHYYELKLKRDGEDRAKLRSKVQRLLIKSIRNPDLIDVNRVIALVKFARDIKGSLLLLDADKAEAAVARYRGRTLAAITCQRVYRGHVARSISMMIRQNRKIKVKLHVAREMACALTARRIIPEIMKQGINKARRSILKPVYSRTHQMDNEDVVLQVFRSNHYDYKYRKVVATCYSCLKWRPRARWDLASQQMVVQHGPCTCKTERPVERMLIRGYSAMRSVVYSLSVSEKEMRRRILLDTKRRGQPMDALVPKACKYKRLPSDYCLRQNIGVYRRDRFEPLRETAEAFKNARDVERFAHACERDALEKKEELDKIEKKFQEIAAFAAHMKHLYLKAHKIYFRTQMQLQAMIYASDNSMHFVQKQLAVFADLSLSNDSQSYDPLENANDHIWIKRKYEAKKSLILRTLEREEARRHHFKAQYLKQQAKGRLDDARAAYEKSRRRSIIARRECNHIVESSKYARPMMVEVVHRILKMLTLRSLPRTSGRRSLVFFEPEWQIQIQPLRPVPIVFSGWNMRYRKAQFLVSQPFLNLKPHRKLVIISVYEDPLSSQNKLPPFVGGIAISIYEPETRKHILLSFNRPDLIDALGPENKDVFDPVEEDADTQFFCPNEGCGRKLRARQRLTSVKDHEIALRPHPYSGVNIGVDGRGGPVLRCPKCSVIFHAAPIDMWSLRTNEPHAGFVQRRNVFDNRRRVLIERLIKLLCLNRYNKDDVILDKYLLRKRRRVLFERLERCYWWRDMLRQKTRGKGVQIYSEGRKVGGGYVIVSIHENNGDLVFEAYHPRSGLGCSLRVLVDDVTSALNEHPKWADYWESSVKTNVYSTDLLRHIVDKLTFITVPKQPPPPWEGIGTLQWDALGFMEEIRKGQSRGLREDSGAGVKILVLRKRLRETYSIKHQEVRTISGQQMTASVLENSRGDMILEAHDPRSAHRHSLNVSRDRLRVVLKDEPKLLSDRGIEMWRYMLNLVALRPDPDAGRHKMMVLRLKALEKLAEDAALKCIHTFGRMNSLKKELEYAKIEHHRLVDLTLAAEDVAEADGGKHKPMTLLRMLAKNLNDAKASRDLAKATCDRLVDAVRDCESQFYDETLERKKHLRVCSSWRREVAHQKLKSGLRLVLSNLRPKEHWKRIFYGTRYFGGRHIKGRLVNASHFIVEVMIRQFGTYKDSRNIWIRMRPETTWEGDRRRSREERVLMSNEEIYRHVADRATSHMLENIRKSVKVTARRLKKKTSIKKLVKRLPAIENKATDRLRRLTQLSRKLGMGVILKYGQKDDEAITDPNITVTVENRSRIAFPQIEKRKAEAVIEEKSALKWEPVFASIEDETVSNHTMYPSVYQSLKYVTSAEKIFGLKVDKVSQLLKTSGIDDNMYPSVVFQLKYKFRRKKEDVVEAGGSPRLPDETKAFILLPEGIHFWNTADLENRSNIPPEVVKALQSPGKGKWRPSKSKLKRRWRRLGKSHYSIKDPMSVKNQLMHEADSKEFGKVWFRTTRKIRNTTAIITVQGVSQTGRRHNSAVDLSSILRVEIYDPARAETHAVVIDADDLDGKRWKKHLGINRAAIELADKLVLRPNTLSHEGGLMLSLSPSAGTTVLPVHGREYRFCKRAALLPYCTGSGNEAYSSLSWLSKLDKSYESNRIEEKPKPLLRTSKVCKGPGGKAIRLLVSLWRGQGGARYEAYHPESSMQWTIEVSDDDLAMVVPPSIEALKEEGGMLKDYPKPFEMQTFALRKALEVRGLETHGIKEDLQKRLKIQIDSEIAYDEKIELKRRMTTWVSRRTLRGVGSTLGVSADLVNEEETKLAWDKFIDVGNCVGAISNLLAEDTVRKITHDFKNALSRKEIADEVDGTFENLIAFSPDIIPIEEGPILPDEMNSNSVVTMEKKNSLEPQASTTGSVSDTKRKKKSKGKKGKKKKSVTQTNVGGVDLLASKSDDFMEGLDMDDQTSATFEHLFVEEFDANTHKTQHIRRVSSGSGVKTGQKKMRDESGDIEWNLSEALEQKESAVESSLDLFERDEVDNNTGVSNSNEMPSQFTGVFLPVNSAKRAKMVRLGLATWQSVVLRLLGQGNPASERRIERMLLPRSGAVLFYRYSITRNLRASVLAQQDVVGDVIWMMRGEKGKVNGSNIIKSDASAAKRLSELKPDQWIPTKAEPVPTLDAPKETYDDGADQKSIEATLNTDSMANNKVNKNSGQVVVTTKKIRLPRWRKNLKERRSLRNNCKPAVVKELYQEATSVKALPSATIEDDEDARTEYSRRTYRRSALEYAAEVNKMRILSTKVHQYELESLVAASREGREAPYLGHRPLYENNEMLQWMLKHLTLQNKQAKIVLDRTICKVVRRLPPHGRLVILQAIRGKGKSPGQGLGRLFILGFEPATQQRMVIVPDEDVLTGACEDLPGLLYGPDCHRNMRRIAERIISQLVIMNQNGVPTLSHHKMRWVQDSLEREEQLMAIKRQLAQAREKELALRFALQVACRRRRMERFRLMMQKRRRNIMLKQMKPLTHEWGSMMGEDMYADRLRGFLTANENVLAEIRAAFDVFDADGSGEIDAKEFQQLAYEVGELMDKKQIAQALKAIDRDGSGEIDFGEFAMWWLTADHGQLKLKGFNMALLNARMSIRKGIRDTIKKAQLARESARLAGQMYAQRQREQAENARLRREAELRRKAREAQRGAQTMSFLAQANARVAGKFEAKAGGSDRIKVKKRWDDDIPGGIVGKVLAAPYFYPKFRITQLLAKRAEKRQKALARQEVQAKREAAAREAAAQRLKLKLIEEERREKEEAERERKQLEEAQKAAMRKARELREKMEKAQKEKEEAEKAEKKRIAEEERAERQRKAEEEKAKRDEAERLEKLAKENEEEYAKQMAEKAAAEEKAKAEEEARLLAEKQAKQAAAQKKMEETMAKKRAEEEANSAEAKLAKKQAEDAEREKRQKRLQRRAQGSGKLDAAARAKDREEKRKERAAARAAKRGNVKGKSGGKKGGKDRKKKK